MKLHDISKQLDSSLDARLLLKHVTGLSDADLIGLSDIPLNEDQKALLDDFILQRLNGRPISKIIGIKEFYGRDFIVSDDVLDPRPDSELLIDIILRHCEHQRCNPKASNPYSSWIASSSPPPRNDNIKFLDLGTGSGCLILTLLAELPQATGIATDISDKALDIACKNADKLGVQDRVEIIKSDWFSKIEGTYDIILSNPPYINSDVVPTLDKNVRDFDPILALDGGDDGLLPYKMILPQVKKYLNKGGVIALEHGYDQCGRIKRLIEKEGLSKIRAYQDLGGHSRVLTAIHK